MKGEMEIEVLKDTTEATETAKARRRMGLCVMSAQEQEQYAYAPSEARNNDNPGYPCEDYGEARN
jgi:hypothetical protein